MKVVLEFSFEDDREEYDLLMNGRNYHSVIVELDSWLRSQHKYDAGAILPDEAWTVRARLAELLAKYGVTL